MHNETTNLDRVISKNFETFFKLRRNKDLRWASIKTKAFTIVQQKNDINANVRLT